MDDKYCMIVSNQVMRTKPTTGAPLSRSRTKSTPTAISLSFSWMHKTCLKSHSQNPRCVWDSESRKKSTMNLFRLAGDMTHLFSIIVLLLKIHATKSCSGIQFHISPSFYVLFSPFLMIIFMGLFVFDFFMWVFIIGHWVSFILRNLVDSL